MVIEFHLSTCIQFRMTKHTFPQVMNFRHLPSCDTIVIIDSITRIHFWTDYYNFQNSEKS